VKKERVDWLRQEGIDSLVRQERAEYIGFGSDKVFAIVDDQFVYELRNGLYRLQK